MAISPKVLGGNAASVALGAALLAGCGSAQATTDDLATFAPQTFSYTGGAVSVPVPAGATGVTVTATDGSGGVGQGETSSDKAACTAAPLRAVAPALVDTVRPLPVAEIGSIHADPVRPQPVGCGSAILPSWDDEAVAVVLDAVRATTPHMLEIRHLGGALSRPVDNAVGHRDAHYSVFTSAYPRPGFAAASDLPAAFYRRLAPWSRGRSHYNFSAGPDGPRCFDEPTLARLTGLRKRWDPQNLFRFTVGL